MEKGIGRVGRKFYGCQFLSSRIYYMYQQKMYLIMVEYLIIYMSLLFGSSS
jgi:hypothetical protein